MTSAFKPRRILLDDGRMEEIVDLALQRGAVVVGDIDLAREFGEAGTEVALLLASTKRVFDVPKAAVDLLQLRFDRREARIEEMPGR